MKFSRAMQAGLDSVAAGARFDVSDATPRLGGARLVLNQASRRAVEEPSIRRAAARCELRAQRIRAPRRQRRVVRAWQ